MAGRKIADGKIADGKIEDRRTSEHFNRGSVRKADILAWLKERGDYVSGQEICEHFGVSRTAVWKAIGQLRAQGCRIDAVPNRGYLLLDTLEAYGADELKSLIHTKWAGQRLCYFDTLGSTNIQAKVEAENGAPHGTLVVADMQTAGRGRRGRGWVSPAKTNLYFTIMLRPDFAPEKASMLTLVMAHATARAIRAQTGLDCGIKWPNDIVVNGKKICGILTEMSVERGYIHYVVIGVGVNVREQEFPSEIADKAACLDAECGAKVSRSALLADIMSAFEEDYESFLAAGNLSCLKESYDRMLVNRDRQVCVLDPKGEFRGTARGITDTGELLVEKEDGESVQVYAGEVSVRGIYGYI